MIGTQDVFSLKGQMASVPGLYALGDVVLGLNQITVASGEAAIAGAAIPNRLRDA